MYMMNLIEKVQYKAGFVVSGCWQGTSQDKLFNELGWESLSDRRWYRRLCLFYKIINHDTSQYLYDHIPAPRAPREVPHSLSSSREFNPPATRTLGYSNSFFPYCISEWERLGDDIKSLPTLQQFKTKLMSFIRPPERSMYKLHDIEGPKF